MRLLGAIIAGGRSRRFGSDKGAALLDGRPLLDHVADGLRGQIDRLVICGRAWPGLERIADRPAPDLGPLGGLCGALDYANAHGFDAVLSAGCDVLPVPAALADRLAPGPACVAGQRLLGLWPVRLLPLLERHLQTSDDRSIRAWMGLCAAIEIPFDSLLHNINTQTDLDRFAQN